MADHIIITDSPKLVPLTAWVCVTACQQDGETALRFSQLGSLEDAEAEFAKAPHTSMLMPFYFDVDKYQVIDELVRLIDARTAKLKALTDEPGVN